METAPGNATFPRKSWKAVAVLTVFAALLVAGLWQLGTLQRQVATVTFLSVGVTRSDVEDIRGEPVAWITEREELMQEPWSEFPASTRPIETAVAAYREGEHVLYVYYDQDIVSCLFYSERGGFRVSPDRIRPPMERSR
ncbi:MAG: hypothetical protein ACQER1_11105 [Armatimonadota bacterium]